jgi:hypothetical protein
MKHIKTQQQLNETQENLNISDVMPSLPLDVVKLLKQVKFTFSNYEDGTIGKNMSNDADALIKKYIGNRV